MKRLLVLMLCIFLLTGCAAAIYDGPAVTEWVLTQQSTTQYNNYTGESQTSLQVNSYDSFGNLVHICFYTDGELTTEEKRTYDDRGNCIREVTWEHFWIFSYPFSRTSHTYDNQNRLLTTTYRNGLGIKTGSDSYTYDDKANTITWDGTYDTETKYLNENGDILRVMIHSKPSGMEIEVLYEYDELGRNTKVIQYWDGDLSSTTEMRYDDQDRLLETTLYDASGVIITNHSCQYTENTITTWDMEGYESIKTLRPDGLPEKNENYDPDGNLLVRTDYTYTEIRVPAKEE